MNDNPAKWERLEREISDLKERIEAADPDALRILFDYVKRKSAALYPPDAPDRDVWFLANVEKSFITRIEALVGEAKRKGQLSPGILFLEDFGADIEDWFQSQTKTDMGSRKYRSRYGADQPPVQASTDQTQETDKVLKQHLSQQQPKKTPSELKTMRDRDPKTWTLKKLAENFYPGSSDKFNTKKSWLHHYLKKA